MTMKKSLLVLLIATLLLVGCTRVVHGSVSGKIDHPAETVFMPMVISTGKSTMVIMVPMTYPESYSVVVTGKDKDGKDATQELYVDRTQFDLIRYGDSYACGGEKQVECATERPGGTRQ